MNKLKLLIFLILGVFCNANAQTIKSLGYNTTNGRIVAATNVVWTNAFNFSTNTVTAQVQTNLGVHNIVTNESANTFNTNPLYPMFIITVPSGTAWTDFELKATRTNFTGTNAFYFQSSLVGTNVVGETGGLPRVWFTDSSFTDVRRWRLMSNSPTRASISAQRFATNGSIGGIVVVITNTNFAKSATDGKLIYSYIWMTATARDADAVGRQIWRPIYPTQWVSTNFAP